jgi:hypothetical protein
MVLKRWVSIESYLSYLGLTEEDSSDKLLENVQKEVKNVQGV